MRLLTHARHLTCPVRRRISIKRPQHDHTAHFVTLFPRRVVPSDTTLARKVPEWTRATASVATSPEEAAQPLTWISSHPNDRKRTGPAFSDPQHPDDEAYKDGKHTFQFTNLNAAIEMRNKRSSMREEPPFNDLPSRAIHNILHQVVFEQLRKQVAADSRIPESLFDPPRTYIQVHFASWPCHEGEYYSCPCCLPEDLPFVEIRAPVGSPNGITKASFLEQVGKALYGGHNISRHVDALRTFTDSTNDLRDKMMTEYLIGNEDSRPVIDSFSYMVHLSCEGHERIIGHIYAMTRGL